MKLSDLSKLKKLPMPMAKSSKKKPESEDMELSEEESAEEGPELEIELEGMDSLDGMSEPEEVAAEGDEAEATEDTGELDLSALTDDELMAELKKRGLSK